MTGQERGRIAPLFILAVSVIYSPEIQPELFL
jgi:hypothetical protein